MGKTDKRYVAVTALDGFDELYSLSRTKEKKFEKLFGSFESNWKKHEEAVEWLRNNAKYLDKCTCVASS
jgi:hypothetical protein